MMHGPINIRFDILSSANDHCDYGDDGDDDDNSTIIIISRQILAPPSLRLHNHTDLDAHDFPQSLDLRHQSWIVNVTGA